MYKDGGTNVPDSFEDTIIVHVYPSGDTIDDSGELNGYYQNLFFKMIVFDLKTMTMYKPNSQYDAIFTYKCDLESVSVFKDGAYCMKIKGAVWFLPGQACTFYGEDYENN